MVIISHKDLIVKINTIYNRAIQFSGRREFRFPTILCGRDLPTATPSTKRVENRKLNDSAIYNQILTPVRFGQGRKAEWIVYVFPQRHLATGNARPLLHHSHRRRYHRY